MDINTITIIIFGVVILVFGVVFLISKVRTNKESGKAQSASGLTNDSKDSEKRAYKKNPNAAVPKDDIFNFMEFDKIQDDMIIQQKGEKYTAVIKCKGINYALMSEVEQLSVEEGFMNFLNTLKYPVQLYVQAQTVNLKSNINDYKEHMRDLYEKYDDANSEYSMLLNSLEATDEEIQKAEDEKNSINNVLEYGQDIVRYVERLALNKSMLQRSFYVLVSYYKSELTNASSFNKEELLDICYSELFTRVQNIMSGLSMCSVESTILNSNAIAELIYSAYNRDDKNFMSVEQALESGFHRLYSTSEDAVMKKRKKLIENMKIEAEYKAIEALNKAIDDGTYATVEDIEDEYDQETSKQALEIIKKEKVSDEIKNKAKKIIVDNYKEAKKERIDRKINNMEKLKDDVIASVKAANGEADVADEAEVAETVNPADNSEDDIV